MNTLKIVDIWKNRPYQNIKNSRLTYHKFDAEGMEIIPYNKQETNISPNEYSLFTTVTCEGNHVIVNYELRSLLTDLTQSEDEFYFSKIISVKHTLHIYDLSGNLLHEIKDLPSVDDAVISQKGEYMLFIFGGIFMATTNNPIGSIERTGWALMRLKDQKIIYREFTDDGKLAIQGAGPHIKDSLLSISYSTPKTNDDVYDYFIFYDERTNSIYKKLWTHEEWSLLSNEWKSTENKQWKYYIKKFNFQQISITQE